MRICRLLTTIEEAVAATGLLRTAGGTVRRGVPVVEVSVVVGLQCAAMRASV